MSIGEKNCTEWMSMSVKGLMCPKCGAPVSPEKYVCDYCGTYYVVEGGVAYTLDSRPATDENLEMFIERDTMYTNHLIEAGGYERVISEEDMARYTFLARDHLREELGREPTILEVANRVRVYLTPKKIQHAQNQAFESTLAYMLGIFIIFIIFIWIIFSFL